MENWKDVTGWEGLYQVSDLGRVKALPRTFVTRNKWGEMVKHIPERIKKLNLTSGNNYLAVTLTHKGRIGRGLVHRLVCEAFHGPAPSPHHHCAHADGDPLNNRADNLRWATPRENAEDTRQHGRMRLGENSNLAKLAPDQVRAIRARADAGEAIKSLAAEYGLTREGVSAIVKRKNWRHI